MSIRKKTIITRNITRIFWIQMKKRKIQCRKNIRHPKRSSNMARTSQVKHLKDIETQIMSNYLKFRDVGGRRRGHKKFDFFHYTREIFCARKRGCLSFLIDDFQILLFTHDPPIIFLWPTSLDLFS